MKNLLILFSVIFLMPQWAESQYTWFNRLYNLEGGGVWTTAMNIRGDSLECIGIGAGSDENHPEQYILDKFDINMSDGILLNETFCFPIEPICGVKSRATSKLSDGSWLHYSCIVSDCFMVLPTVLHLTPDLDLINQRTLYEISDCEDKEYFTDAMADLGNSEYLLTTRIYFGWPVADSTGHYFHRMNLDGEIVESRTVMHPNYGTDRTYHHVLRQSENSLIIYGEAAENFTAIGPFIQRTDLWGNPTHELIINNDDLVWGEVLAAGMINNENDLIYAHVNTLYYNNGQNYGEFELFAKRINTDSLNIIENKQIVLPFLQGNTYNAFNPRRVIQTIEGGYLALIQIANDGGAYPGLVKLDADLNLEWFKTYYPEGWQTYEHALGFEIINTPDGGYAMAGRYNGKGWVVKLDHCGNEIESGCEEIISVEENSMTENHLHIYPNPASDEITISTSLLKKGLQLLEVYSTDGRLLLRDKVQSNDSGFTLSLTNIPSGNYFVVLKDDKESLIGREMLLKN